MRRGLEGRAVQVLTSQADNRRMQHVQSGSESPNPVPGPASWSLDLTTGELRSSAQRARLLQLDPATVTATAEWWDGRLHPQDRAAVVIARSEHVADGGAGYRCEYRAQRRDGEWIRLLEVGCIERDPAGVARRIVGVLLDVTAERSASTRPDQDFCDLADAQQALRKLEHRLAVAESSANLGLWEVDIDTGTGWANDQYFVMLGYRPNEFAIDLQTLLSMIHPDDIATALALSSDLNNVPEMRSEFRMRAKDGSYRWIHTVGRPLTDSQGRLRMAGVHLDVTERKEAELRRHAAERLESVGKLAAGVAHEINTPVQFVSDSIYFVRDGLHELLALTDRLRALASRDPCNVSSVAALSTHLPYLVENLPKALERSLDGLKRVSEIVGSMRELSHPDRPEMSDTDVNHVVQSALVIARSEYKYVANVRTDLMPLPHVRCHAGELTQVILNLVINASHAIAELVGDSGRKGTIEISSRHEGDSIRITISDTGAGIPDTIRHRVFEPFFTTKDVGRGTGQGLAISHNIIVQRHGGSLDFESVVGKGTAFHLCLPCAGPLERVA